MQKIFNILSQTGEIRRHQLILVIENFNQSVINNGVN